MNNNIPVHKSTKPQTQIDILIKCMYYITDWIVFFVGSRWTVTVLARQHALSARTLPSARVDEIRSLWALNRSLKHRVSRWLTLFNHWNLSKKTASRFLDKKNGVPIRSKGFKIRTSKSPLKGL